MALISEKVKEIIEHKIIAVRRIIILVISFLSVIQIFAQTNQIKFRSLDINKGLSSNQINTIFKDSQGFLWIGAVNGLNRFDGYSTRVFRKAADNAGSSLNNNIFRIFEDCQGRLLILSGEELWVFDTATERFLSDDELFNLNIPIPRSGIVEIIRLNSNSLWFVTRESGLFGYNHQKKEVVHIQPSQLGGEDASNNRISGATASPDGMLWLVKSDLSLEKVDVVGRRIVKTIPSLSRFLPPSDVDHGIFADSHSNLWIFSRNENEGLLRYNLSLGQAIVYKASESAGSINSNVITAVIEDDFGNILVGTDHGGLSRIHSISGKIETYKNDPADKNSLAQNSITCLYRDNTGIIWIGTYKKGVSYYHPDLFKISTYILHPYKENWLGYDDVNTFAEDSQGNLWIGTNGGGLFYFDRQKNIFKSYKHNPNDNNSLSSNVVVDVLVDHLGDVWVGTYMGGLNRFDGRKFTRFMHNPSDNTSIAHNNIWSLFEDSERNVWIGTLGGGLDRFDRNMGQFVHHQTSMENSVHSDFIMAVDEGSDGNLWLATTLGFEQFDRDKNIFTQFAQEPDGKGLISNTALDVFCDRRGWVWVATREGLNLYDPKNKKHRHFTADDGMPINDVLTILEDDKGNMWLGTPLGLCNLIVSSKPDGSYDFRCKNYDEKDGLHSKAFNEHGALKTRRGELVFGGPEGFSVFKPENLSATSNNQLVTVFAGLEVQNKPISVGQEISGRILLPRALSSGDKIVLKHFEKTFAVWFAALNYLNPEKTLYHYILEGFNNEWVTSGGRKLTYTNLHPGDYTLRVYSSDFDNERRSNEIVLQVKVLPPFWKTKWAYSLYLVLFLVGVFYALQSIINRERNKFLLQQERIETAKVHEMDMLKLKFFTNISHEIRTPLTLILSPLEKIIGTTSEGQNKEQLKLVQRNAKRLLTLINQLLDFRRLEVQGLSLLVREEEFVSFCRETTESFSDLSESRDISLSFSSELQEIRAVFDYDKIEKILFNLLSNAFKFTNQGGSVGVRIRYNELPNYEKQLVLEVSDTGIGIQDDKQEAVFERFVQSLPDGVTVNKGSGIGLSLTREFVQMHGGTIGLKSKVGEGSTFTVVLPLKDSPQLEVTGLTTGRVETTISAGRPTWSNLSIEKRTKGMLKILLVEDNPDIRFYLKDNLSSDYQIIEAENGSVAWDVLLKEMPDLIVSDIMMPVMDGLELCRKVKTDNRTSHVPMILLTARNSDQHKYEGLETGADDYITKPFNFELLMLKIKNLIEQRKKLRQSFQQNIELQPSEIEVTSLDEKFLRKIKDITENKMHEPDFSVEKLSTEFGISRAHLYNKLLSLTGKTPIEYIRILRIRRAAQLLEKSQLTVMEIAYKVGFNDPRYFTKHFKSEYNMTPSQYAKKFSTQSEPDEPDHG